MKAVLGVLAKRLASLALLLVALTALLFFMLRATADQALVIAGPEATAGQLAEIRAAYGLDRPLPAQFASYVADLARLEFGDSIVSGQPATAEVGARLWATVALAFAGMGLTIAIAIPLGAWLGARPWTTGRRGVAALVFVLQGTPGFVVALLLVQLFAVQLKWLPFIGYGDFASWIMPTLTLASFLAPKLTRVVAANVQAALAEDHIRTARANGATFTTIYWRHALPNALLGTQFAFLLSGSVITESIFAWPGIGTLLIRSIQNADFAVVQAVALAIAVLVFSVNALTEALFQVLDPRLRRAER